MGDRTDRSPVNKAETRDKKSAPAANEAETIQRSGPAPKDDTKKEKDRKRDPQLALSHREAEIIAQNLKESGTRR